MWQHAQDLKATEAFDSSLKYVPSSRSLNRSCDQTTLEIYKLLELDNVHVTDLSC